MPEATKLVNGDSDPNTLINQCRKWPLKRAEAQRLFETLTCRISFLLHLCFPADGDASSPQGDSSFATAKASWTIKKAKCQRTDAFHLWWWRRFLDSKEIKPVNPKGNQPSIFIERTDAEAEAPILWPPDAKSCLIGKDPDAGKD